MLTVWCVCIGTKYDTAYVYALKEMVEHYLTVPHEFVCITTEKLPGITTRNPPVSWQSWWSKLGLFAKGVARSENLYFDLDVVITGNIDYLVPYTKYKFAAPENWAKSGYGGVQSSVMAWDGSWHEPAEKFNYPVDKERLWGDQEYLWELLGNDWTRIPGICSYKYHCKYGIPEDKKVVVFHGKPDPHEVRDEHILEHTETLRELRNVSRCSDTR